MKQFGKSTFMGDNLPAAWSANEFFIVGKEYPVYWDSDGQQEIVIGENQKEYKFVPGAWSYIKEI